MPAPRTPALRLDALDPRDLPAANVLATFADGVLTLTAATAAAAEHIRLEMQVPVAIDFSSSGQVHVMPTDPGTTVNNFVSYTTPLGRTVRSIRIDLKAGDDGVEVSGVQIPGALTVQAGDGNNTVFVDGDTHVGGAFTARGGSGNDTFSLVNGVTVGTTLTLAAGAGANEVNLLFGVRVGGTLSVSAGVGDDTVKLGRLAVGGGTAVALGDGTNKLTGDPSDSGQTRLQGPAKLAFGAGADTFDLAKGTVFGATLTASLGAGSNVAELEAFTLTRAVAVTGGAGTDIVRVADGDFLGSLTVGLGSGINLFSMDDVDEIPGFDPSNLTVSTRGTTVLGALTVTGGAFADQIDLGDEQPVRVFGPTRILTGDDVAGGDSVKIDDTSFYGSFLLVTGAGSDYVGLDAKSTTHGTTLFAGPMTVRAGAGLDQLQLGADGTAQSGVYFVVKPTLDGGAGAQDKLVAQDYFFGGQNTPLGAIGWEL